MRVSLNPRPPPLTTTTTIGATAAGGGRATAVACAAGEGRGGGDGVGDARRLGRRAAAVWATVAALGAAPARSETGAGAATATPKQPIDYVLDLPAQGVRAVRDALRGDPAAREPGSGEGEGEGKGDAQGGAPGKQAALNVGKAGIAVLVADAVVVLFMGSRVLDAISPATPDPERPQPRGWKEKLVDALMANQDGAAAGNDDTPKDASSSSPPRTEGSDDDAGLSP